jgi:hypothetical protein
MPTQPFVNACLLLNVARAAKVSWSIFCSNYCRRRRAKQQHRAQSPPQRAKRNEKCRLLARAALFAGAGIVSFCARNFPGLKSGIE